MTISILIRCRVSTSICKLLFDSPKTSDALLFMTILSTDLRSLRRRGYNGKQLPSKLRASSDESFLVDRILHRQKAEREAAEEKEKAKQITLVSGRESPALPTSSSESTLIEAEKSRTQPQAGRNAVDNIKDHWRKLTRNSVQLPANQSSIGPRATLIATADASWFFAARTSP